MLTPLDFVLLIAVICCAVLAFTDCHGIKRAMLVYCIFFACGFAAAILLVRP